MVGVTALGVGSAAASGQEYDVVEVPPGESHIVTLGDNDVLENTLIDITASGAEYRIVAKGDDWEIRDVGVRGAWDTGYETAPLYCQVDSEDAMGVIENVYFGDPVHDELGEVTGLYVPPDHAGTLEIDRMNVQDFGDNGIYASDPGNEKLGGLGGDTIVTNSYSANNEVSNFRIGTEDSYCENCVGFGGHRGVWSYFEHTELVDCEFGDNQSDVVVGIGTHYYRKGAETEVTVTDSRFDGVLFSNDTNELHGESAGEPEHRIPEGVPESAEAAASGRGPDAE